jgi:RHS repeat-associated protein
VVSDTSGAQVSAIKYYPFGTTRSGSVPTDKQFTGQRLDGTGLYYYNARYYDPQIGRFISADSFVQWSNGFAVVSGALTIYTMPRNNYPAVTLEPPVNPQTINRYSYVINNPLRYNDPYGYWTLGLGINVNIGIGKGWTGSLMLVVDGNGNIGLASTGGSGNYFGSGLSACGQLQFSPDAETVYDLKGDSDVIGSTVTLGPTSPESLFTLNAGLTGGAEVVIGDDYRAINVLLGPGFSLLPLETHNFDEKTDVWVFAKMETHNQVIYKSDSWIVEITWFGIPEWCGSWGSSDHDPNSDDTTGWGQHDPAWAYRGRD